MASNHQGGTILTAENKQNGKILGEYYSISTKTLRNIFHKKKIKKKTTFSRNQKKLCKQLEVHRGRIEHLKEIGVFSDNEQDLLLPKGIIKEVNSERFDSSLLYKLIRNFSGLKKPRNGWNEMPDDADNSREANIVRLHIGRNVIQHGTDYVEDEKAQKIIKLMKNALVGLGVDEADLVNILPTWRHGYFTPVGNFTGRTKEIDLIHQFMMQRENNNKPIRVVVHGMPAVGKSEFARTYFSKHENFYERNILWISSASTDLILESFKNIAQLIGLNTKDINGQEKGLDAVSASVYEWFKQEKVLYVFDDAPDMKTVIGVLPQHAATCTLITSQHTKWSADFHLLPLNKFTTEESENFIKTYLKCERQINDDQLKNILCCVDGHPLAIQQFVAFFNETLIDTDKYVEYFKSQTAKLLKQKIEVHDNELSAVTTILMALDRLKEKSENGEALINTMSYLYGDEIHFELLCRLLPNCSEPEVDECVQTLRSLSLINVRDCGRVITIHMLIQKTLLLQHEKDGCREKFIRHILQNFFDDSKENVKPGHVDYGKCWIPHFLSMVTHYLKNIEFLECLKDNRVRIEYALSVLSLKGKFLMKKEVLKSILTLELDDDLKKHILSKLGTSYRLVNDKKNAEIIFKKLFSKGYYDDETLSAMAGIYYENGNVNGLLNITRLIEDSLLIDPNNLDRKRTLANVYIETNNFDKALKILRKIMEVETNIPSLIIDCCLTATCLANIGSLDEAIKVFNQALVTGEEPLGKNNIVNLTLKFNFASTLLKNNRAEQAVNMLKDVIKKYKEVHSSPFECIISAEYVLVECYLNLKEYDKAINIIQKYASDDEFNDQTMEWNSLLVICLFCLKRVDEAAQLVEKCLCHCSKRGRNDAMTHRFTYLSARCLFSKDMFEEFLGVSRNYLTKLSIPHQTGMVLNGELAGLLHQTSSLYSLIHGYSLSEGLFIALSFLFSENE